MIEMSKAASRLNIIGFDCERVRSNTKMSWPMFSRQNWSHFSLVRLVFFFSLLVFHFSRCTDALGRAAATILQQSPVVHVYVLRYFQFEKGCPPFNVPAVGDLSRTAWKHETQSSLPLHVLSIVFIARLLFRRTSFPTSDAHDPLLDRLQIGFKAIEVQSTQFFSFKFQYSLLLMDLIRKIHLVRP